MPKKKGKKIAVKSTASVPSGMEPVVDVARLIGSSLGTAAAKTENVAKEIGTLAQAVGERTAATSRTIYKHAAKSLRAAARSKPKKRASPKRKPRKTKKRSA